MSVKDLVAELDREREAHTRRERHGRGELTLSNGVSIRATGCTLPDGSLTDAECLTPRGAVCDDAQRVWTRRLPGTPLRRRGRHKMDRGKALLFFDEPTADFPLTSDKCRAVPADLERDLRLSPRIRDLVRSDLFAMLLYGALCNTTWRHKAAGTLWQCSWRHAGGIVADLRGEGDYLDWYCSTGEGLVDDQVLAEIEALGWVLAEANPSAE